MFQARSKHRMRRSPGSLVLWTSKPWKAAHRASSPSVLAHPSRHRKMQTYRRASRRSNRLICCSESLLLRRSWQKAARRTDRAIGPLPRTARGPCGATELTTAIALGSSAGSANISVCKVLSAIVAVCTRFPCATAHFQMRLSLQLQRCTEMLRALPGLSCTLTNREAPLAQVDIGVRDFWSW